MTDAVSGPDLRTVEPPAANHPLLQAPNGLVTPPIA